MPGGNGRHCPAIIPREVEDLAVEYRSALEVFASLSSILGYGLLTTVILAPYGFAVTAAGNAPLIIANRCDAKETLRSEAQAGAVGCVVATLVLEVLGSLLDAGVITIPEGLSLNVAGGVFGAAYGPLKKIGDNKPVSLMDFVALGVALTAMSNMGLQGDLDGLGSELAEMFTRKDVRDEFKKLDLPKAPKPPKGKERLVPKMTPEEAWTASVETLLVLATDEHQQDGVDAWREFYAANISDLSGALDTDKKWPIKLAKFEAAWKRAGRPDNYWSVVELIKAEYRSAFPEAFDGHVAYYAQRTTDKRSGKYAGMLDPSEREPFKPPKFGAEGGGGARKGGVPTGLLLGGAAVGVGLLLAMRGRG